MEEINKMEGMEIKKVSTITIGLIILIVLVSVIIGWNIVKMITEKQSEEVKEEETEELEEGVVEDSEEEDEEELEEEKEEELEEEKKELKEELWIGIQFPPNANTNNDHQIFLKDFETLTENLASMGINTIVFRMQQGVYHFTFDDGLNNYNYPLSGGFNALETKKMAEIARGNGMRVVVFMNFISHQTSSSISKVYPEFMIPEPDWEAGKSYSKVNTVEYEGETYKCLKPHVSNLSVNPSTLKYWWKSGRGTRDPFNKEGEDMTFSMIDELIDAFTVNSTKPEAFHIGGDEIRNWLDCPEECNGMTSAEVFNMSITKVYNHIKKNNPEMEVMMWGDMLDPYWNGGATIPNSKNTFDAVDMIPKDLVISDWRYKTTAYYRYDSQSQTYPSVGEFLDKGFRVLPMSWNEDDAGKALIWTGNQGQLRTGKILGHLFGTFNLYVVPGLALELLDVPGRRDGLSDYNLESAEILEGVVYSMKNNMDLINIEQCRGTDYYCGAYPNCESCNSDGFYEGKYKDYYCNNNVCSFDVIDLSNDYVSYWKFDGNVNDEAEVHNGIWIGDDEIYVDEQVGQALNFDGDEDYVDIDSNLLRTVFNSSNWTVTGWFKTNDVTATQIIEGWGTKLYSGLVNHFVVVNNNRLFLQTNNGSVGADRHYSWSVSTLNNNQWYFFSAGYNGTHQILYLDGVEEDSDAQPRPYDAGEYQKVLIGVGYQAGILEQGFNGTIDDVMVYNKSLTDNEINTIYINQKK